MIPKMLEKDILDLGFYLSRKLGRPLVRPDWISVNVTLRCNLSCRMCVTCYDAPDELYPEELIHIVDQAADWGVPILNLLGGEPFVRKDLGPVLERAQERGLITTITTNGTLLDEETVRLLARLNLVHLNFSIDGLEPVHDDIRGKGAFRKVTGALKAVRDEEQNYLKEPGFFKKAINVNTLITSLNLDQLTDVAELARNLGADKIQFLNLYDHGPAARQGDLWIKSEDFARLDSAVDRLLDYFDRPDHGSFGLANTREDLEMTKLYYRGMLKPEDAPCYNGYKELYINVNGDGLMCDGNLNFTNGSFGNARRQGLREMWNSPAASFMRKRVASCRKPCLQNCYLRRESDRPLEILARMTSRVTSAILPGRRLQ